MLMLLTISAIIACASASQSNYNNFNKQQYNNLQSQSFNQNYQHQAHHSGQYKPQQQQQQHHHQTQQQQQQQQQKYSYQPPRNFIPITSYKNELSHDGSYQYSYSTGNGIRAEESGYLKNRGSQQQAQVVQGSYSFTSPEGKPVSITYIADELGFRAQGDAIPTSPPIPEAIAKSLQLIARTQPAPATHNFNSYQNNQQYNQQHQKYGK